MAKIAVVTIELPQSARGRHARPNEYLTVVSQFDDGKWREVKPTDGETVAGELAQLRTAAKGIERSVSYRFRKNGEFVLTAKDADSFVFALRTLIVRAAKEEAAPMFVVTTTKKGK